MIDTWTSLEIRGTVEIGGKVIENFDNVKHKVNIKMTPLRGFVDNFFVSVHKSQNEGN